MSGISGQIRLANLANSESGADAQGACRTFCTGGHKSEMTWSMTSVGLEGVSDLGIPWPPERHSLGL